jgi:hypothetical protein
VRKYVKFVTAEQEATYGSTPVYEKLLAIIEEGLARVEKVADSLQKSAKPDYAVAPPHEKAAPKTEPLSFSLDRG